MRKISDLVRPNIRRLKPYSSARDEYTGKAGIFLDANENSIGSVSPEKNNRYPDPYQSEVKAKISEITQIDPQNIFLGNGSDEAIDLLIRIFCEPGEDEILTLPPTYGMYKVAADINNITVNEVQLDDNFDIDVHKTLAAITKDTKMLFVCSPNNPSGNMMSKARIRELLNNFDGIVVVDEAYIDFSNDKGMLPQVNNYFNLVVLRTFSKAWGMANIRLGMAFANREIIQYMSNVKPPYNVNGVTQQIALKSLQNIDKKDKMIQEIINGRKYLEESLAQFDQVEKIYPSDSNFLLVKFKDSDNVFEYLMNEKIIVRNRSNQPGCDNCLRITVGTKDENKTLIKSLKRLIK